MVGFINSICYVFHTHMKASFSSGRRMLQLHGGYFGTTKTIQNLQHHFHWPSMQPQVEKFIRACALFSQSKPSNRKHGLYQPMRLPSRPWESISMEFFNGLPTTRKNHGAILVVVCRFSKIALFTPWTKTTTVAQTTELYFRHVWPHFGLRSTIILDKYSHF